MKIEIRKSYVLVDGEITSEEIFKTTVYSKRNIVRELDFRESNLKNVDEITIVNKSGKNYNIISTNDWCCTLKTSQMIDVKKGYMPYMSQKGI